MEEFKTLREMAPQGVPLELVNEHIYGDKNNQMNIIDMWIYLLINSFNETAIFVLPETRKVIQWTCDDDALKRELLQDAREEEGLIIPPRVEIYSYSYKDTIRKFAIMEDDLAPLFDEVAAAWNSNSYDIIAVKDFSGNMYYCDRKNYALEDLFDIIEHSIVFTDDFYDFPLVYFFKRVVKYWNFVPDYIEREFDALNDPEEALNDFRLGIWGSY